MIVGCIVGSAHPPFGLRLQLYKKSPLYLFITRSRFGCFRSSGRHLLFTKDRHSIGFLKLLNFCPFRTQMGWGNGIYALPTSHPPLVAAVSYKEGSGWEMTSCSQCVVCSVCSIGWGCRSSPSRPGTQRYVHFKWILPLPAAICSRSIFNMSAITSCNMFTLNGFCRYQLQAARMSEIHSRLARPSCLCASSVHLHCFWFPFLLPTTWSLEWISSRYADASWGYSRGIFIER